MVNAVECVLHRVFFVVTQRSAGMLTEFHFTENAD